MIQYALKCADGHSFDSWFQSADAFDKLAAAGMVSCAICGGTDVTKSVMAPNVRPARNAPDSGALSKKDTPAEQAMAHLKKLIEENSDYVGMNFAAEARSMHDGDTPARAIHGEANAEEARKLLEDGVPVAPLPFVPKRKTN